MKKKIWIITLLVFGGVCGHAQETDKVKTVNIAGIDQDVKESTASISLISGENLTKRSAKNVTNSLFGYGLGLTALQNSGSYSSQEPTLYIRGLQTLSSSTPLMLVDGIERDITLVTSEEVESVQILKDAAAVALYGYKGANGVINIITKRGKYNTKEIKFTFDHLINWEVRRPEFANAYTYASAINEAYANDGIRKPRYHEYEMNAFKTGAYPQYYPNVNWVDEVFKDAAATNIANMSLRGGGSKFRYFAMFNWVTDNGFIANAKANDGYSTQNKSSKANLRTNLDIDLTPSTKMTLNLLGTLAETNKPGDSADLWSMIYSLPATAFPVKTENGLWGGNTTWDGTKNPVAQSQAAAYTKGHNRSLYADMTLKQDLSSILPGLGAGFMLAYDNWASYVENHSKTYRYGSDNVQWKSGKPVFVSQYTAGTESEMNTGSELSAWKRNFNMALAVDYKFENEIHSVYTQLKWNHEYRNINGVNNTWFRENFTSYTHYGFKGRYYADLSMAVSSSNKLAPGHKWAFSPTLSLAWAISKEKFMEGVEFVDFLKLRASVGIINIDNIPEEAYWQEIYTGGSLYNFNSSYSSSLGSWKLSKLAAENSTHEKAYKYNAGIDATLFGGLNLTLEGYYQRRSDIWVATKGKYSSVIGFDAPYENGGIVDSWGMEIGANYLKTIGNVTFNVGGNFTLAKNKIVEQYEASQLYDNLVTTGGSLNQLMGLQAIGLFKDQKDIDESPRQTFSTVKPGDIKYRDVNGDKKIDANDKTAIGYSTVAPEIYYSFNVGAEWKGLGFNALFQGTGHYSAMLNTQSVYWPLVNNTTISQHYYENRWTPETPDAKYPRLTSQSNNNNFQNNTLWLADRSFLKLRNVEIYYKLPDNWMKRTKIMNNARIYVRGNDLLCFDHIKIADPESYGVKNPLTRSVVAGLTIGF